MSVPKKFRKTQAKIQSKLEKWWEYNFKVRDVEKKKKKTQYPKREEKRKMEGDMQGRFKNKWKLSLANNEIKKIYIQMLILKKTFFKGQE